jgi:FkbM family methyltransferase
MFDILEVVPPPPPIRILDLGAMLFPGETTFFEPLLGRVPCEIIGFDAQPEACEKLRAAYGESKNFTFLPYAIADGSERTLYVCALQSRSSLYPPNMKLCERFESFADYMRVIDQRQIQTYRLDDIPEAGDVDWVKMDIQGAEVEAVRGGAATMQRAMVVETEVEFVEQYEGQPLFAEVDQSLRTLGFAFHTFLGYGTRPLKPVVLDGDPRRGFRQWLWADAVYIPDVASLHAVPPAKLLKMAIILHEVYRSFDYVHYALTQYDTLSGTCFGPEYLERLREGVAGGSKA